MAVPSVTLSPIPTIVVEDTPDRQTKRQRLEQSTQRGDILWVSGYESLGGRVPDRGLGAWKTWQVVNPVPDLDSAVASLSPVSSPCVNLDILSGISSLDEPANESTIACFGMLVDLPVTTRRDNTSFQLSELEPVYLGSSHGINRCADEHLIGTLDAHTAEALEKLAADGQIELELTCSMPRDIDKNKRRHISYFLSVILYGPKIRADDVGDFVGKCGFYLQDPLGCRRNVPYVNPHRLSSLDEHLPMTFDLQQEQNTRVEDIYRAANDVFAGFETTEALVQTQTPYALRTQLQLHQQQALTFFKRREMGLGATGSGWGIWTKHRNAAGADIFINTITDQQQSDSPPAWRGGILADEMGLGKTLSMIALIASDKDVDTASRRASRSHGPEQVINSTLVVVPPNVLLVWETQLKTHVHPGQITWFKHHGKNRFNSEVALRRPDVVFTTYQTVEREQRNPSSTKDSVFSFRWNRIILDEAHVIRNHKTSTARATASLLGVSRWAISGTPIQNNLTDFVGLFKYLRFHPYDDPKVFDDDISKLWRNEQIGDSVERFKRLLSCVMIRRLKTSIKLTPRHDRIMRVLFDPGERVHYHRFERPVAAMLDDAVETHSSVGRLWFNAIEQINKLRIVCNLGISASSYRPMQAQPRLESNGTISEILAARLSMGDTSCHQCLQMIELARDGIHPEQRSTTSAYYSTCSRLFCANCATLRLEASEACDCESRAPSCTLQRIFLADATPRITPSECSASPEPGLYETVQISSKVRALVSEIQAQPGEKSVVFSFWTSSLDMVQQALEGDGIHCARIDGRVSASNRKRALDRFRNNPEIRAILVTISCGAVGIDLTAASRAHLLEPQWNPSIEEQALARIHRLGQTRPVTTTRYVMKDSIEEHIVKVQDRKKLLATLLLSNGSSSQELRSLVRGENAED